MLRTLIVDDEAPARARMRRLLSPFIENGRLDVVGEAGDGVDALDRLTDDVVDLVLLDIQMPGMDGFDVLDRLPPGRRPVVVFVTAFDQYALRAFDEAAIDYLLKPVDEDRLSVAIDRAERLSGGSPEIDSRIGELLEILDRRAAKPTESTTNDFLKQLSVPGNDRISIVPVADLIAAEIDESLTRLFVLQTPPGGVPRLHRHTVSYPLDTLERRLDPEAFMRVHRSALIQIEHIREMVPWFSGRFKLILTGGHEVIASRARSKELRDRLTL